VTRAETDTHNKFLTKDFQEDAGNKINFYDNAVTQLANPLPIKFTEGIKVSIISIPPLI
jgi:hypothetical protein